MLREMLIAAGVPPNKANDHANELEAMGFHKPAQETKDNTAALPAAPSPAAPAAPAALPAAEEEIAALQAAEEEIAALQAAEELAAAEEELVDYLINGCSIPEKRARMYAEELGSIEFLGCLSPEQLEEYRESFEWDEEYFELDLAKMVQAEAKAAPGQSARERYEVQEREWEAKVDAEGAANARALADSRKEEDVP